MPEDVFGTFEQLLASEDPSASFDFLVGRFRAAKDYRSLFEARLMKKRLELGLPLFLADDLSTLPSELRETYGKQRPRPLGMWVSYFSPTGRLRRLGRI